MGGGSSKSTPVDMTPGAFKQLQQPFANVLAQLLGGGTAGFAASGAGQFPGQSTAMSGGGAVRAGTTSGGTIARGMPGYGVGPGEFIFDERGGSDERKKLWKPAQATQPTTQPGTGTTQPTGPFNPNDILGGIPFYQGPTKADIGANEQTLLNQLMGLTGSGTGGTTAGPNSEALAYLSKVMGGDFMGANATPESLTSFAQMLQGAAQQPGYQANEANPFLNAAIEAAQRPTIQALEETLSRTLPGRFTQAGQFTQPQGSSAFDRAAAIATRGAGDALADIATNLSYATMEAERGRQFEAQEGARARESEALTGELQRIFQGQQAERDRQNEAAGLTSQVKAQEVDTLVKNLQAQALPRLIEEFGIERGMEVFNNRMNGLLSALGITAGVTQPTIAQQSKSTQKPNILPALG